MKSNTDGAYEHFALIRHSPEYRNFLFMEEMRAEMQPPLYIEPPEPPEPLPVVSMSYSNLEDKIRRVEGIANYAKTKVQEHISHSQKKKKTGRFD